MKRYTYYHAIPCFGKGPIQTVTKYTKGEFKGFMGPMGPFGFIYAHFMNRRSEVLVPLHDLTPETKQAIGYKSIEQSTIEAVK